ncbi:MAG: hypothetical protein KGI49_01550 [Patescibacteria group bacterium]|nr:hypothetical protein [Patescibacteria group bacterium]
MYSPISRKTGFTLVETLIYATGLVLLTGVIVSVLYYGYGWYRFVTVSPRVDQVGTLVLERLEGGIRAGRALDSSKDIFDVPAGSIGLNALDTSKNSISYEYYLENGRIMYSQNGGTAASITPADLYVSQLRFHEIATSVSTAIHFSVSIDYPTKNGTTTNSYSGLAIMRNSYQ